MNNDAHIAPMVRPVLRWCVRRGDKQWPQRGFKLTKSDLETVGIFGAFVEVELRPLTREIVIRPCTD